MEVYVLYTVVGLCLLCLELACATRGQAYDMAGYYNRKSRLRMASRARTRGAYYYSGGGPVDDDSWGWSGSGSGDPQYNPDPPYKTAPGPGTGVKLDDDDDIYIEQPVVADKPKTTDPLGSASLTTPSCLATTLATLFALTLATRHRFSTGLATICLLATLWVNG